MQFFKFLYALVLMAASHFAFAHGGENRVEIELNSPSTISAGATVVSFQMIDNKLNQLVTPAELNVDMEKQLHFIAYDPALKEFQHVHPQFDGKFWNVDMNYSVDGSYFVWAQGQLTSGPEDFSTFVRIDVSAGKPAWPEPVLGDVRSAGFNGTVATLSNETLKAGEMAMLSLTLTKNDGTPANITPYLGAFAHLISTPLDGDALIPIHPMDGKVPNVGTVDVTFPEAGDYRIWVQFIDDGILKIVPLSVTVAE